MSGASVDRETERRANELYWQSDASVNHIADELELSKGTLYGLIRPRPAGLSCPECAEEVVYPNRTAKERALVACPACGWEGEELDAEANGADVAPSLGAGGEDEDEVAVPPIRVTTSRQRIALGGALLGAAAGLALVLWARRR